MTEKISNVDEMRNTRVSYSKSKWESYYHDWSRSFVIARHQACDGAAHGPAQLTLSPHPCTQFCFVIAQSWLLSIFSWERLWGPFLFFLSNLVFFFYLSVFVNFFICHFFNFSFSFSSSLVFIFYLLISFFAVVNFSFISL